MKRVLHLMKKELLELRQDPRLFSIVILAPIIQLSVLGYAATTDVKDIPLAIVDADRSTASRELVHRFESSANFKIVAMPGSTSEIDSYLDRGEAWMAISIPPDYGRRVASGRPIFDAGTPALPGFASPPYRRNGSYTACDPPAMMSGRFAGSIRRASRINSAARPECMPMVETMNKSGTRPSSQRSPNRLTIAAGRVGSAMPSGRSQTARTSCSNWLVGHANSDA